MDHVRLDYAPAFAKAVCSRGRTFPPPSPVLHSSSRSQLPLRKLCRLAFVGGGCILFLCFRPTAVWRRDQVRLNRRPWPITGKLVCKVRYQITRFSTVEFAPPPGSGGGMMYFVLGDV